MPETALVLAPHTDDGEFGAGATIARLVEEGWEVHYAAFSRCERSVPAGFPPDVLEAEMRRATAALGIAPPRARVLRYEVREFPAARQGILEDLIALRRELGPSLVLLPCAQDVHQDHATLHQEGVRAFKDRSLLGYELPWNNLSFRPTLLWEIAERHLAAKLRALACYESQAGRPYADPEFLRGLARLRGVQLGAGWAEAFEVIRWTMRLPRAAVGRP